MLKNYRRVMKTAKRPSWEEFKQASKITGLAMLIIGFLGLMISMVFQWMGV